MTCATCRPATTSCRSLLAAVRAAKPEDLHRRLALSPDRLSDMLCHHEQRHVGQQLTLAYDRKQLVLERSAASED